MKPAITVEKLAKLYQIGHRRSGRYRTLRETLMGTAAAPWRRLRELSRRTPAAGEEGGPAPDRIWALKDVSFEVQPGDVVGVIGRNGAGKSTLLKVLSRITEPTAGRVELRGRVGSLLEVGTGFHPELTGRENIFLNGAVLGMGHREIARKFDDIVEFAEISQFLDTPVKRYSSGMYMRLAFAVAAHLAPEILIVDEVLAVGDATYQKRCIDRMAELARSGNTILFVSHNMDLIPRLCRTAIRLESGRIIGAGEARHEVEKYLASMLDHGDGSDLTRHPRTGDGRARYVQVQLIGRDGRPRGNHPSGDDLVVRVKILSDHDLHDAALAVNLKTISGARIHSGWTRECGFPVTLRRGEQYYECRFRNVRLRPGYRITVGLWLEAGDVADFLDDAWTFEVIDSIVSSRYSTERHQGIVLCDYDWTRVGPGP